MRLMKLSAVSIILAVTYTTFAYSTPSRLVISTPRKSDVQLTLPPPIESAESPPPTLVKKAEREETRTAYLERLKSEIIECLSPFTDGHDLLSLLIEEELPHRAFSGASRRFGGSFTSLFDGRLNLVRLDEKGQMHLTRDAQSAWAWLHSEIALT